ncbi:amidohydrolase family protein [Aestuariicella hydrocarbonica]|uniref:Amidohydrolase family protein n=1 Tax=Pseudomaricurvus hydrocarbonicus TaxID=1470433 RepID=A0A9E5MNY0_9GAMM|nr:amidohydrolase family protein [Aestuariicella hydrocarbonica]NHO67779.1 amidohydrolase family protein [Aestuariicella hydrocarbonica]
MRSNLQFFFALATVLFAAVASGQDHDLVIKNGRVMDPETGFDQVANVGIDKGVITKITEEPISGKETIDATGHVVAPGFIDFHNHIANTPFGQRLALRDGVTTPLEMEAGGYPIDMWYKQLEGRSQTNYGATVSTAGIREKIAHPDYDTNSGSFIMDITNPDTESNPDLQFATLLATPEQLEEMRQMFIEGVEQGGLGIGGLPGYMTDGTKSEETIMWQQVAGKYGLAVYIHGRFSSQMPPTSGILGTQEFLASVGIYGGGLYVHHVHQQTLDLTPTVLDLIEDAQNKGMKVLAEIYPYYQGQTIVSADYLKPETYERNMGRDYGDLLEISNMQPLTKERYEEMIKTSPQDQVIFGGISEEGMLSALADPRTVVGSDAPPMVIPATGKSAMDFDVPFESVSGHPRAAGTHAKVLKLVREKELMPLMLAIKKMTIMHANWLEENGAKSMSQKGRLQVGKDADITIFNPVTVTDNSTYKQGALPSTGIPYVVVNGTVVVKDSKVLEGVYPGKAIKNDVVKQ